MAAHNLLLALAGTTGALLGISGVWLILRPRHLLTQWFDFERRWRQRRFAGGWSQLEMVLEGRGYFWVPADIELASPDDLYAYVSSNRFWRTRYGWFIRLLCMYAGTLMLFFGIVMLVGGIF